MLIKCSLPKAKIVIKDKKIFELIRGKKVLHLGAVGTLHQRMRNYSKFIVGVDIDKEGIDKEDIKDIIYGNIEELDKIEEIKNINFDYIIAADVIEHLSNPGKALDGIRELMTKNTKLIITVPNVFGIRVIATYIFEHKELVDPTHTFWPSYITLSNLLKKHGFIIESFYFCLYREPTTILERALYLLKRFFPFFSSGLFFICREG